MKEITIGPDKDLMQAVESLQPEGGVVYLTPGEYRVPNGPIYIPENVRIEGIGSEPAILQVANSPQIWPNATDKSGPFPPAYGIAEDPFKNKTSDHE